VINRFQTSLSITTCGTTQRQHSELTSQYFAMLDAIDYTITHDDGTNLKDLADADVAGGVIENKHSTDVESPPPPLRVYMSIHPAGTMG